MKGRPGDYSTPYLPRGVSAVSVFRLEPIPTKLSDPAWQHSTISEAIWAGAIYPIEAREMVAQRTISIEAIQTSPRMNSPWLDAELTTCVWVSHKDDVPLGSMQVAVA